MVLPLENTFEGGTNGSTVTTAGSGGASGDAFDAVTSTPTWAAASARRGALGMQTTTGAQKQVSWNATSLGSITDVFGRVYFQGSAIQGVRLIQGDGSTTSDLYRIAWTTTTGTLNCNINGGTNAISTNAIPINTWVRIEWRFQLSGGNAIVTAKLFLNPDSSVPDDTITKTAASADATITGVRIGCGSSVSATLSYDDLAVQAGDYPGPVKKATLFSNWNREGGARRRVMAAIR